MMTITRASSSFALFAALLLTSACAGNTGDGAGKSKGEAQPAVDSGGGARADEGRPAPIAGTPVDGPGKVATVDGSGPSDDKPYTVEIDAVEGKVGEPGKVSIQVVPAVTWHVNLEYPTKLEIEVPAGVEVAKAKQGKDDAVTLTEANAEFAVSYTASEAGAKAFTGELRFAVCQDTACVPKSETLAFEVAVK